MVLVAKPVRHAGPRRRPPRLREAVAPRAQEKAPHEAALDPPFQGVDVLLGDVTPIPVADVDRQGWA